GTHAAASATSAAINELSAEVTGKKLDLDKFVTSNAYTAATAGDLDINGVAITFTGGETIDAAIGLINAEAANTGVTASKDAGGNLVLTSAAAFVVDDTTTLIGATSAAAAGLASDAQINVNGVDIDLAAGDDM